MCKRCDDYADQREADAVPERVYHAHDTGPTNSRRCAGCGERIQYNDIIRYDGENDLWWHEGCELEAEEPEVAHCFCGERLDVSHHHGDT